MTKVCEIVVLMSTTISQIFIEIGSKTNEHSQKVSSKSEPRFLRKLNRSVSCLFTKNVLLIIFFVLNPISTKLCEIVVLMSTTISQSFIEIGSILFIGHFCWHFYSIFSKTLAQILMKPSENVYLTQTIENLVRNPL